MLMSISDLSVRYGAITALHGVSLEIKEGEILSILGANGAGKSTLLKTVTGLLRAESGDIRFQGRSITRERPDRLVQMGICLVPEGRRIFPDLSVKENLELGAYTVGKRKLRQELFALALQTFPRLKERLAQPAGTLSGGEQQMLAVGRALMANPRLLLLDEPSMGLSPLITKEIFSLIRAINTEKGISLMLVEQNAHLALEHSHRAYVLESGRVVMEGLSSRVKCDPAVMEAYLGFETASDWV
ncbi:MAG: ABC transporter ATP-binding protein [Deltaproteobacteria bacterium]|nr:ABC transporter ATP-binding protein [Deltaproteobacteria bacterium]